MDWTGETTSAKQTKSKENGNLWEPHSKGKSKMPLNLAKASRPPLPRKKHAVVTVAPLQNKMPNLPSSMQLVVGDLKIKGNIWVWPKASTTRSTS